MGVLTTGYTWPSAGQVTSTLLNNMVNNAAFASGAVDNVTIGLSGSKLSLKDDAVTNGKIADDAVGPEHIGSGEFTFDSAVATTSQLLPYELAQDSSTMTLDLGNGNFQIVTMSVEVDTVNALANMATGKQFTFVMKANGSTGFASDATWDSTWKWQGGVVPASTMTNGAVDIISGVTDGTNAYVTLIKNFA